MQNRTFLWLLYVRTFLLLLMSGTAGEVILSSTLFFFYESEANQLSANTSCSEKGNFFENKVHDKKYFLSREVNAACVAPKKLQIN